MAPFKNSTFYKKIINNFLKSSSIKNDVPFEELTLKNQNKIEFLRYEKGLNNEGDLKKISDVELKLE